MRLTVLFPLACSIVAFVLAFLALFAGRQPGFMEDYAIVRVNMSMFGHDLVPTPTSSSNPTATESGIGGIFTSILHTVTSTIENDLNNISNDIADKLSADLGIHQWYSLHLMDACEGSYTPNATHATGYNVSNCTTPTAGYHFNLSATLDEELQVGPLKLNLGDLQWPESIQNEINKLNELLLAIFIFYVLGIGFSGLGVIFCLAAIFMAMGKFPVFTNFVVAFLAAVVLAVGSAISTVASKEGSKEINKYGSSVSVVATMGNKFITITWVAFATMAAATLYWIVEFCVHRRQRKRSGGFKEKPYSRGSM